MDATDLQGLAESFHKKGNSNKTINTSINAALNTQSESLHVWVLVFRVEGQMSRESGEY